MILESDWIFPFSQVLLGNSPHYKLSRSRDFLFNRKIRPIEQKPLRAGTHCGGKVLCRQGDPPQAENPASGILFYLLNSGSVCIQCQLSSVSVFLFHNKDKIKSAEKPLKSRGSALFLKRDSQKDKYEYGPRCALSTFGLILP